MNIKSLITTSVVALISASAVQAADVVIPHEAAPVITAPTFSWTGFYLGAQIGGFSSNIDLKDKDKDTSIFKDLSPKLSGLIGGIYTGSNFDLGNGIILGVETDMTWSGKSDVRVVAGTEAEKPGTGTEAEKPGTGTEAEKPGTGTEAEKPGTGTEAEKPGTGTEAEKPGTGTEAEKPGTGESEKPKIKVGRVTPVTTGNSANRAAVDVSEGVGFKQKWAGATRVRIGFAAADRIMPYVAGGVAYTQIEASHGSVKVSDKTFAAGASHETATMVGFTIGGGIDFAMTDNVLLRAEYRYSDYGKKKFFAEEKEYHFKTNDFRVGVAYKF